MPAKSRDQEIIATLTKKIGSIEDRCTYDDAGNLVILDLSGLNISQLPAL